jgi:hypothetical protein
MNSTSEAEIDEVLRTTTPNSEPLQRLLLRKAQLHVERFNTLNGASDGTAATERAEAIRLFRAAVEVSADEALTELATAALAELK